MLLRCKLAVTGGQYRWFGFEVLHRRWKRPERQVPILEVESVVRDIYFFDQVHTLDITILFCTLL